MSDATTAPDPRHVPVLPAEVLALAAPANGEVWVDCTLGGGGHTRLLAERVGPAGRVYAVEQDPAVLADTLPRLTGLPVVPLDGNFEELPALLAEQGVTAVDGVLADLGVSSDQLDDPARGLSFMREGPLDMRLDPRRGPTAADLLRTMSERELAEVFFHYGEERFSRRVARRVVEARQREPLTTTTQLAELVRRCVPGPRGRKGIDPATRVFQALRIAVNDELGALERLLKALPGLVRPGGRAAIISFHSLEDRRVKQAFRDPAVWSVVTKKPVTAGDEEVARNPRSRSAKLRVARRVAGSEGVKG
jgi:16S rRNA (cytosine1402-N4)-methyltransferase